MYRIIDRHGEQKFSHLEDAKAYAEAVHWQTGVIVGIEKIS